MPPYVPQRVSGCAWGIIVAVVGGLIYAFAVQPSVLAGIAGIVVLAWGIGVIEKKRQLRVAAARRGESICTFARSFDCRRTDTWIVRAVWEELGNWCAFPLRREDRLADDLGIDSEDLDDLAEVVAQRTGRTLEECEGNPWFGKVTTVGALVSFFEHQPRRGESR
jgi:hypothetical protein